jgi:uncharacterized damage-inducible protein DinB
MPRPRGPAALFADELEQEAVATRRIFERLPPERLAWRPHPRSYSLGQLALHVASLPGIVTGLLAPDEVELSTVDFQAAQPGSVAEVLETFERTLAGAREALVRWDEADLATRWRLVDGSRTVMAAPKGALLRSLVCNHLYHHRGQLTVYLRLLDVPLPSVYGPSADENVLEVSTAG